MGKKVFFIIILIVIVGGVLLLSFDKNGEKANDDYLRIHIKANSDSDFDQQAKYKVRDNIVNYLTSHLSNCRTKDQAKHCIIQNLADIQEVANRTLYDLGISYTAKVDIRKEEFPIRSYDGLVLEAGIYDALIIDLGQAKGQNWWCVAFPPLCFVPSNENIQYRSKILEIIKKFKEKSP